MLVVEQNCSADSSVALRGQYTMTSKHNTWCILTKFVVFWAALFNTFGHGGHEHIGSADTFRRNGVATSSDDCIRQADSLFEMVSLVHIGSLTRSLTEQSGRRAASVEAAKPMARKKLKPFMVTAYSS
jgi:hypothetical protein